jgi:hypothetical protein
MEMSRKGLLLRGARPDRISGTAQWTRLPSGEPE